MSIHFRLDESEESSLRASADERGMSLSRYVKGLLSRGKHRSIQVNKLVLDEDERNAMFVISKNLSRIGGNLNQLARSVNQGDPLDVTGLVESHALLRKELSEMALLFALIKREIWSKNGKS